MRGILTFEQELRASRLATGQKNAKRPGHAPDPKETERPWQRDIDQVQETMREVLRAVANLSGVELPGLPADSQGGSGPEIRMDIKTLKDRFRHDLEGFSIKTTEELSKRAREQTRTALDAMQNEVGGRIDQVAAEFREKLQLSGQLEKLLEPSLKEATARLESSLVPKVEQLLNEQDQWVQDKLQGVLSSAQAQIGSLEQTVQRSRDLQSDLAAKLSTDRTSPMVEDLLARQEQMVQDKLQGALSSVQARISSLEQTVQHSRDLQSDLAAKLSTERTSPMVEDLLARQEQMVQDKLQGALSSVQARMSSLEQTVQHSRDLQSDLAAKLSTDRTSPKVEEMFARQEQMVQDKLQGALSSVQARMSSLEQTVQHSRDLQSDLAAKLSTERTSPKVEEMFARQEQLVQDRMQGVLSSVQARIGSLELSMQQSRNLQSDLAAKLSTERTSPKVEDLLARQEQLVQDKLQGALSSVQFRMSSLEQTVQHSRDLQSDLAAKLSTDRTSPKVEEMFARQEQLVQDRMQGALSSVHARIGSLEQSIQQIRDMQFDLLAQLSEGRSSTPADTATDKHESSHNHDFKGFLDQAFSRIECSFSNLLDSPRVQSAQSAVAKLDWLRRAIPGSSTDQLIRVQQALDNLDRLGSKKPLPAS